MHFQVDAPDPIACEECGVQGEFVRFGKRDVPYRDLSAATPNNVSLIFVSNRLYSAAHTNRPSLHLRKPDFRA
jgi:hypothetical protein